MAENWQPTGTKGFYIPSSEAAQSVTNSDASLGAAQSGSDDVASDSTGIPLSATAPQLDSLDIRDMSNAGTFRSRAHSAPSILYQQVALQLRSISDDFNAEYTQTQPDDVVIQNRRLSMPALEHQWNDYHYPLWHQHDTHQRPYSPRSLHILLQNFRALHEQSPTGFQAGSPGRRRNESISEETPGNSTWEPD